MFKKLYPYQYIDNIFDFDFQKLYDNGFRGLIFDIDNTLVPDNAPMDERCKEFLSSLGKIGFTCFIISNNGIDRVKTFADEANLGYFYKVHKPSPKYYVKAAEAMGLELSQVAYFGDQIFTDILGANNAGIRAYLTKPIDGKTERLHIKFKRLLEKPILKAYKSKC